METVFLLSSTENTKQVEEEEKYRFVRMVMESIGLDLNDIWDENGLLTIENKIKFREILSAYHIQIVARHSGELYIYSFDESQKKDVLIGEWRKPQYILKTDHSQVDPRKKLYLEMKVNYWTIFESPEE